MDFIEAKPKVYLMLLFDKIWVFRDCSFFYFVLISVGRIPNSDLKQRLK